MNLNNLRISTKLIAAFAVVLAVFTLSSAAVFASLGSALKAARANSVSYENSQDAAEVLSAAVEQQNALRGFAATGDATFLDTYGARGDDLKARMGEFRANTSLAEQRERMDRLAVAVEAWQAENQKMIDLARAPATLEEARARINTVRLTDVRAIQGEIMQAQDALVEQRTVEQEGTMHAAQLTLVIGSLIALAAAALMAWMLSRAIAAPVGAMTAVMGRLAGGDNGVDVPALGRRDELGEMAKAVLAFKEAAIAKLRAEDDAARTRTVADSERQEREAEKALTDEHDAVAIGALAQALGKLAAGDLTHRITVAFQPKAEQLKTDFNAALSTLQQTMSVISANTSNMQSGAGEISSAADDLSRRTEQQAASLEETAAALDQITATVRRTADGANHARSVVQTARSDAQESAVVVQRATDAMGAIEQSSSQIGNIIGVIDEIAFQTNLLALNAGVEAARAGDAGKGFAVVASEVRALAQRSAEAAKEIKTLISASTTQVEAGVNLVAETGKALQRIVSQVAEINGVVSEIAASAQEQATGLHQVNAAVNQMDQVTQQNAAMVEQSTAASHALATEAVELARLMGQFSIGAAQASATTRRPTANHAAKPLRGNAYRSGSATALKLAPQAETDTWEEF